MKLRSTDNKLPIVLFAISNTKRIQIIDFCTDWKTMAEISEHINLKPPSVHSHITALLSAELLEAKKNGRRVKVYKRIEKEIRLFFADADNKAHS